MSKETLEEKISKLEKELSYLKMRKLNLKGLKVGDFFEFAGVGWRILDITSNGYHCLAEENVTEEEFDSDTNNWSDSKLRKWLNNDFFNILEKEIGAENIVEFERDLLSLDGQTEYGKCDDKVSLLSVDEYRKYRKLIPTADGWWWLLTPWSTKRNNDNTWIAVVSPAGLIVDVDRCRNCCGVRPFCIFSSSIFESEEE